MSSQSKNSVPFSATREAARVVVERLRQQGAELERKAEEVIRTARAIIEELHGRDTKSTKTIHT